MWLDVAMDNVVRVEVVEASSSTYEDVETYFQANIIACSMTKDWNETLFVCMEILIPDVTPHTKKYWNLSSQVHTLQRLDGVHDLSQRDDACKRTHTNINRFDS